MVQRDQWDTYWGPKKVISCFAAPRRTTPQAGRAGGILSIPAREMSLGSPRVGTIHVQSPTAQAPPLQAFSTEFSRQPTPLSQLWRGFAFQGSPGARDCRVDNVCGTADYPLPDLTQSKPESRSAPEKSVQFGPDGAPSPSKTSITRGPPVVAVAVSLDPILPHR